MIAYEDLVASLNRWRARQGLATTPPDYGEPAPVAYTDVAEEGAPDEVYDLSDDSGLIMTEDLEQAKQAGVIEVGVEIAQTADEAVASDYDDPPGTADYGSYDETGDEIPVDAIDVDEAGVIEEQAAGETLEADAPEDVDVADMLDVEPLPMDDKDGLEGDPEALPDMPSPDDEPLPE